LGDPEASPFGGSSLNFIDSSVFLFAFLIPRGDPPADIRGYKVCAKEILRRVHEGERVMTSTAHISEIANILESRFSLNEARRTVSDLILLDTVEIAAVDRLRYEAAVSVSEKHRLGLNDSVAYSMMRENGIKCIYSYDKDFDGLPGIERLTD
jgi:predicted nucleic acid-binding protein